MEYGAISFRPAAEPFVPVQETVIGCAPQHDRRIGAVAKITIREWIILAAAVASILGVIDQHIAANKAQANADESNAALASRQADLEKAQAENAALMTISLPGFLQTYNFHIEELRLTTDAFEKAKAAKGAEIPRSDAASKAARAQSDLFAATDIFTDFVDRWRAVAQSVDQLLGRKRHETKKF